MTKTRRFLLAMLLSLTAVAASAGCLSEYAHNLYVCDSTMGGMTEVGCKVDAWIDYHQCVAAAAIT